MYLCRGADEEYFVEWPELYARILRFNAEYCGKPKIHCPKTGLTTFFKFKDKPVFGGKWHVVEGYIVRDKEPAKKIIEFAGTWNSSITFVDCQTKVKFTQSVFC
jgi:hypothetical protein